MLNIGIIWKIVKHEHNYNYYYSRRMVYGEVCAVLEKVEVKTLYQPPKWFIKLPVWLKREIAKFLCSIGLRRDGGALWNNAMGVEEIE